VCAYNLLNLSGEGTAQMKPYPQKKYSPGFHRGSIFGDSRLSRFAKASESRFDFRDFLGRAEFGRDGARFALRFGFGFASGFRVRALRFTNGRTLPLRVPREGKFDDFVEREFANVPVEVRFDKASERTGGFADFD
jgi:hypothetical protein